MSTLVALLVAYAITVVINVAPAFVPPTWAVLAFFLITYHVPLLPLTVGGAVASSAGRVVLALATRYWGRKLLSDQRRHKLTRLGEWIDDKPRWAVPLLVFLFALGPVPSNALFIAVGLTEMRLAPVFLGFFVGRVVSYTVLDLLAKKAASNLIQLFFGQWHNPLSLAIDVLLVVGLVVFARIDWPKLLHIPDVSTGSDDATSGHAHQQVHTADH